MRRIRPPHPWGKASERGDRISTNDAIRVFIAGCLAAIGLGLLVHVALADGGRAEYVARPHDRSRVEAAVERCLGSQKAISFYRQGYRGWRERQGLPGPVPRVWYRDCDTVRRRAAEWRTRADVARVAYAAWFGDQWNWRAWLPRGWQGIIRCETHTNWRHDSGDYQGAFGFAAKSWDDFVPRADPSFGPYPSEAYLATPRQQYEVALAIFRRFGLTGWGCRGSFYG